MYTISIQKQATAKNNCVVQKRAVRNEWLVHNANSTENSQITKCNTQKLNISIFENKATLPICHYSICDIRWENQTL